MVVSESPQEHQLVFAGSKVVFDTLRWDGSPPEGAAFKRGPSGRLLSSPRAAALPEAAAGTRAQSSFVHSPILPFATPPQSEPHQY